MSMIDTIKKRLPSFASLTQVYSVIAILVYGWTIYRYVWRLPSWLHYLTMGELVGLFSYAMLTGLVESLLILGILVSISALLPERFLLDNFIVRGTAFSLGLLIPLIVFWVLYEQMSSLLGNYQVMWTIGTIIVTILLVVLSARIRWLAALLSALSDRFVVFLFLLMPLTFLGLVIVVIRNIT